MQAGSEGFMILSILPGIMIPGTMILIFMVQAFHLAGHSAIPIWVLEWASDGQAIIPGIMDFIPTMIPGIITHGDIVHTGTVMDTMADITDITGTNCITGITGLFITGPGGLLKPTASRRPAAFHRLTADG
jgi:hypothetical protein